MILTENMRQKSDPIFAGILTAMRNQDFTKAKDHYDILTTRVITNTANIPSEFASATILTARNIVRSAINYSKVKSYASANKVKIVVVLSQDSVGATETNLSTQQKKDLWHRLESSATQNSIGMMPYVFGMPVLIKSNQAVELGVCNGTMAKFKRLIYSPDEPPFEIENDTGTQKLHFVRKMPVCAIVEIENPTFEQLPGLEVGEFPIFPEKGYFKHFDLGKSIYLYI